jgi:peptide/nickel transport system substrate-binding protein
VTGKFGQKTEEAVIKFQQKYFDEIIKPSGKDSPTGEVGKATRKKLNDLCFGTGTDSQLLEFTLTTVDQPQMTIVAEEIKKEWQEIGVKININKLPISQIEQDYIKPREYEILLFGEVLGAYPDPFPFWHSSQKKDPGLNLSSYQNSEVDKLLENIRISSDVDIRKEKLSQLQNLIIADSPAIFIYSPEYLYLISKDIKGVELEKIVDPSKRFTEIENWYIKTKRIWK